MTLEQLKELERVVRASDDPQLARLLPEDELVTDDQFAALEHPVRMYAAQGLISDQAVLSALINP